MVSISLPYFNSNHHATSCFGSINDRRCNSPLFPSRRIKWHVPNSGERARFIKRENLHGRVHSDCRFHRNGSATVDLNISSNTLHVFILLAYSQSGHVIGHWSPFFLSAPLDSMTFHRYSPFVIPLHYNIYPKFDNQPLFLFHHGPLEPLLGKGVNKWLHLGMISSPRGIKELIDQVPVLIFFHNNFQETHLLSFVDILFFVFRKEIMPPEY